MLAISIPMADIHGVPIPVIAATFGGGIFGDHCSPISDTSIISSMASASDHIDHVSTQLPYALIGGVITIALYLILGFAIILPVFSRTVAFELDPKNPLPLQFKLELCRTKPVLSIL